MEIDPRRLAVERNRQAWNELAERGAALAQPAGEAEFADPLAAIDPAGWLRRGLGGSVAGKRVLCLAAGGGRQGPLHAAAGMEVTVVDLSDAMLQRDRQVAAARGLSLRVVQTSMDDLSALRDGEFDAVVQPVSTCYVPELVPVYAAVARVLRPGGVYVSQHKTPTSLQASARVGTTGLALETPYYLDKPLPPAEPCRTREPGTLEFLHRWEELIGGLCRAGFVVEDLSEPSHANEPGDHGRRSQYVAPYVRILARRVSPEGAAR
ncbi:Ubiquinone biosynthesis O-methyltransferase [Planctomycetes bacterium MalM25]|nr:Ubiquinone biosynthesis O-methyltransferase [Planctomycetes bacterium MalM25]